MSQVILPAVKETARARELERIRLTDFNRNSETQFVKLATLGIVNVPGTATLAGPAALMDEGRWRTAIVKLS